jgi:hypothetical protein
MYNPFIRDNKEVDISELVIEDIKKLVQSENGESIYIEFKERFDDNVKKKIPSLFCSFANEQGGYVLIGIKDCTKEIIGIENNDYNQIIGNIVRSRTSPFIYFLTNFISINDKNGILVIQIPQGNDTPYIVDGTVYRRIGNNSIGVFPCKDRYDFELLLKRNKEQRKNYNAFCKRKVDVNEKNWVSPTYGIGKGYYKYNSLCDIYFILPDVMSSEILNFMDENDVKQIKNDFEKIQPLICDIPDSNSTIQMTFPWLSYSHNCLVLRNTDNPTFKNKTIIWEFFSNGRSKIHLVVNEIEPDQINEKYKIENIDKPNFNDYRYIDGDQLLKSILSIFTVYQNIVKKYFPNKNRVIYRIKFNHVMNRVLHLGGEKYYDFIKHNNIPFSEQSKYDYNKFLHDDKLPIDFELIQYIICQVITFFGLPPVKGTEMFFSNLSEK